MPLPPNGDVKQKNFPVIYSLRHLSPPKAYLTIQTQIYHLCGSDSESEFSDQELEQRDHWEDEDCIDNTLSEPRPNAFTQLKYKEGADSRLRGLYAKRYSRDHCEYNFEALRRTVPDALSSVPPRTIAAFHSRCQRRMEAYRLGLNYGTEEFKNYASHRRVRTEEDDM